MEEGENNPILKLIFEKGPRSGETLECRHGSTIRIGRIIKGNTFTIKDRAISQNHLHIQSDGRKWSVSDLDTSNGTFVNGIRLQCNAPFDLNDRDVIKIGETTLFTVKIDGKIDPPQRNARQQAAATRARVAKKGKIAHSESNLGMECGRELNGADGDDRVCRDDVGVGEQVSSIAVEVEEKFARPRRNARRQAAAKPVRVAKKGKIAPSENNLGVECSRESKGAAGAAADGDDRVCRIDVGEQVSSIVVKIEGMIDPEIASLGRNARRRAVATRTRGAKKDEIAPSELDIEVECSGESKEAAVAAVDDGDRVCRHDSGVGEQVNSIAVKIEKVNLEIPQPRRNPSRRVARTVGSGRESESAVAINKNLLLKDDAVVGGEISLVKIEENTDLEVAPLPQNSRRRVVPARAKVACKDKSAPLGSNLGLESSLESEKAGSAADVDENLNCGEDVGVGDKKDLEKITLGEWFDRMEKYLPKQINDVAEEIIASLRQRHKQFEEFIIEQQRDGKGKMHVAD